VVENETIRIRGWISGDLEFRVLGMWRFIACMSWEEFCELRIIEGVLESRAIVVLIFREGYTKQEFLGDFRNWLNFFIDCLGILND